MSFDNFVTLSDQAAEEKKDRESNVENKLSFGVRYLDDSLHGIFKNDLVLLAGRSGQGKSELAMHIAMSNACMGRKVYYFALEADNNEVLRRLLYKRLVDLFYADQFRDKQITPNYSSWYAGKLNLDKYYDEAIGDVCDNKNLVVRYRGEQFTIDDFSKEIISCKDDAELIILDHLHYMDFTEDNENKALKNIVKEVRNLAIVYGKPIILVCHVRKADKRFSSIVPDLEDIHGSSDIYKIATKAIVIAPAFDKQIESEDPTRWLTYMKVAKCRVDGSLTRFIGLMVYDVKSNKYDEKYKVGTTKKGEWNECTEYPGWAK